jgi:hypothetical protein
MKHLESPNFDKTIRHTISIPFIYSVGISLIFMHICLEIYHQIAFRLYGIERLDSRKYIKIDRHKLSKLSLIQKINCVYCGYANGLLPYATAISAETEKYWCGIKHNVNKNSKYIEPEHHKNFIEYDKYR